MPFSQMVSVEKKSLYRIIRYRLLCIDGFYCVAGFQLATPKIHSYGALLSRYNRISSMKILPEPPGIVMLPLVPRPIAILSTLVRLIP
jgi:hypothetical protein